MTALALDHLVVAARDLDAGLAWCEATFGVRPEGGGRHAWMGTHNRVFTIAAAGFERAYLEIIAIDPAAPAPPHRRWFDLDDSAVQRALAGGPALVHWVARCAAIDAVRDAWCAEGIDPGEARAASRDTPQGRLEWRITVRADGGRPLGGAVPALIDWAGAHPTDALGASGVGLASLRIAGAPHALAAWLPGSIGCVDAAGGAAPIEAVLDGPRGRVTLRSIT